MAVSSGDIIKAVCELTLVDGNKAQNVFHFKVVCATTVTEAAVLAACKQYVEDIYAAVAGYINGSVSLDTVEVDEVDWNPTESFWEVVKYIGTAALADSFSGVSDSLPNQIAPVLLAYTARPKSYGRKFLAGMDETTSVGSDIQTAPLTALGTALSHYLADEVISGADVLSPGIPRASEDTFLEFGSGAVDSIVGTQRRRKPGIGE